jgi:TRAP-type C4-dicarboxylate transport system permease small subunit
MTRLASIAARWSARLGGLVILASAILVAVEVIQRNLGLGLRLHAFELTNFAFAAAVAFGFAWALTERSHIRIDIVYRWLPLPARAVLDVSALASLTIMGGGMAWHGWGVVSASLRLGARPNSTLDIPMAAPQALWAAGLTWFALVAGLLTLSALWDLVRGRWGAVHAAAGVEAEGADR